MLLIDSLSRLSWPGAFALVGLGLAAALVLVGFFIALSGSNYPWEK